MTVNDILKRLKRAVKVGDSEVATSALEELFRACADRASDKDVVSVCLSMLGLSASVVAVDGEQLRRRVAEAMLLVEPWYDASLDDFADVAEGLRHSALHSVMLAAARDGDFATAMSVRRIEDAANRRCEQRWIREAIPSSPGDHALYPSAYGAAQLVVLMGEAGLFGSAPDLLDDLERLSERFRHAPDREIADAYCAEEAAALMAMSVLDPPRDLGQRIDARLSAISRFAQPDIEWPRTVEALGRRATPRGSAN